MYDCPYTLFSLNTWIGYTFDYANQDNCRFEFFYLIVFLHAFDCMSIYVYLFLLIFPLVSSGCEY